MVATAEQDQAIQDQMYPGMRHCFGCGADNPGGLQIKSFWDGEETICTWQPGAPYLGAANYLNGGITGTLIDCHCGCSVVAHMYRREGRGFDSLPEIRTVTAQMNISYLAPVLMDQPVNLRARITELEGRKIRIACSVTSGGQEAARGELLFIRVTDENASA